MKVNRSISDKNNSTAVEVLYAVAKSHCSVEFQFSNIKNTMFHLNNSLSSVSKKAYQNQTLTYK
ncbi:hypothetical protein [Dapis sp. BLCC M229]|uniref:hypothetical protein n=1 Tax=Dapis sp. BLCC M229 TaxID=3400188 RepID=UPI003CF4ADB1